MLKKSCAILLVIMLLCTTAFAAVAETVPDTEVSEAENFAYDIISGVLNAEKVLDNQINNDLFFASYYEEYSSIITALTIALTEKPYQFGERELSLGCVGTDVLWLQYLLDGFHMYYGPKDGNFGPVLELAVCACQSYIGEKADGKVGKETADMINEMSKSIMAPMQEGDDYQEFLAWYKAEDPDGKYQGYEEILYEMYRHTNNLKKLKKLTENQFYTLGERELSEGMVGTDVAVLQEIMHANGVYNAGINGTFDHWLTDALKNYQHGYGIEETGKLDKVTCNMLIGDIYLALETGVYLDELEENTLEYALEGFGYPETW